MSKTIVQAYGPIYGEPVNGTVMGRPNGSVYVPLSNTIVLNTISTHIALRPGNVLQPVEGPAEVVAQSQDLASYIQTQVYSDSALTTLVGVSSKTAGLFNGSFWTVAQSVSSITAGSTYYVRAQLINNGVAVATSSVVALEAV